MPGAGRRTPRSYARQPRAPRRDRGRSRRSIDMPRGPEPLPVRTRPDPLKHGAPAAAPALPAVAGRLRAKLAESYRWLDREVSGDDPVHIGRPRSAPMPASAAGSTPSWSGRRCAAPPSAAKPTTDPRKCRTGRLAPARPSCPWMPGRQLQPLVAPILHLYPSAKPMRGKALRFFHSRNYSRCVAR